MPPRPKRGLTQTEAAKRLHLSQQRVSEMVKAGALRTYPDGSIDPADPKLGGKRGAKSNGKATKESGKVLSYHDARARVEMLKAEKLQLDIDIQRGRFIDAKHVEDSAVAIYLSVREGVEDAIETSAALIAAKFGLQEPDVRAVLAPLFVEVLERLADDMEGGASAS